MLAPALAQDDDVVVLQLGATVETLSEFNQRFEIAIRGIAANQGLQLNDAIRAQLEEFKPAFLEQRVTEVVLVQGCRGPWHRFSRAGGAAAHRSDSSRHRVR